MQLSGLTDHRCFVHFISVEFSKYKYNIELVDLVDFRYLNSTQPSDDRLDRFRGLNPGTPSLRTASCISTFESGLFCNNIPSTDTIYFMQ